MNIGIKEQEVKTNVEKLMRLLASENVFYLKIRNYHWNVSWKGFQSYHKYFEELYNELAENIDEIAERVRTLWEKVDANYKNFLALSFIQEESNPNLSAEDMVKNIIADRETIIKNIRDMIESLEDDIATEDLLTWMLSSYEKELWMLKNMI